MRTIFQRFFAERKTISPLVAFLEALFILYCFKSAYGHLLKNEAAGAALFATMALLDLYTLIKTIAASRKNAADRDGKE